MIKHRKAPPRLNEVYYDAPLYFVTFVAMWRRQILANNCARDALLAYATRGHVERGIATGRYVVMPDHVHLFVRGSAGLELGKWVGGLKRAITVALRQAGTRAADTAATTSGDWESGSSCSSARGARIGPCLRVWQPGFLDHVLRHSESYAEKWDYVRRNPVRVGLVDDPDNWPYQGEVVLIDRA